MTSLSRKHQAIAHPPISEPTGQTNYARRSLYDRAKYQETADAYHQVIADLRSDLRVVVCCDQIQWILQRRKKGGAERPWRGIGYFRTRKALLRLCATLDAHIDPAAMTVLAALPKIFTEAGGWIREL